MEIRRATLEDLKTITSLNVHVQKLHAEALPDLFKYPESDTFSVDFAAEQLVDPNSYFFIASVDASDIGYIFAQVLHREENAYRHRLDFIEIDQISVQPEFQRQGFGKALIQKVRELAKEREIDTITLSVWAFNDQALNFFRRQGFEVFIKRMWMNGR